MSQPLSNIRLDLAQLKIPSSHPKRLLVPHPSLKLQFSPLLLSSSLSPRQMLTTPSLSCSLSSCWWGTASVPYLEEAVPGPRATRHPVRRYSDTAHSVVMAGQHSWTTTQGKGHDVSKCEHQWECFSVQFSAQLHFCVVHVSCLVKACFITQQWALWCLCNLCSVHAIWFCKSNQTATIWLSQYSCSYKKTRDSTLGILYLEGFWHLQYLMMLLKSVLLQKSQWHWWVLSFSACPLVWAHRMQVFSFSSGVFLYLYRSIVFLKHIIT